MQRVARVQHVRANNARRKQTGRHFGPQRAARLRGGTDCHVLVGPEATHEVLTKWAHMARKLHTQCSKGSRKVNTLCTTFIQHVFPPCKTCSNATSRGPRLVGGTQLPPTNRARALRRRQRRHRADVVDVVRPRLHDQQPCAAEDGAVASTAVGRGPRRWGEGTTAGWTYHRQRGGGAGAVPSAAPVLPRAHPVASDVESV